MISKDPIKRYEFNNELIDPVMREIMAEVGIPPSSFSFTAFKLYDIKMDSLEKGDFVESPLTWFRVEIERETNLFELDRVLSHLAFSCRFKNRVACNIDEYERPMLLTVSGCRQLFFRESLDATRYLEHGNPPIVGTFLGPENERTQAACVQALLYHFRTLLTCVLGGRIQVQTQKYAARDLNKMVFRSDLIKGEAWQCVFRQLRQVFHCESFVTGGVIDGLAAFWYPSFCPF